MKCFIVGITGFLGYHAALELRRRGHQVCGIALPPLPVEGLLPPEASLILADANQLKDEQVKALLQGCDALVFAAGADDRTVPRRPAYDFYYEANVCACIRLLGLAKQAGLRRAVVVGSYFAHFDRLWPGMKLAERHPYIRSRKEQERACKAFSSADMEVMTLELPYIFGAMPGRKPLWAPLVSYVRMPMPMFYTRGGTNMVAVQHVAEAIAGALERGQGGQSYLVGDENLTWVEFLQRLSRLAGKEKKVITLPTALTLPGLWAMRSYLHLQGRQGGLDYLAFASLQTAQTFFDPAASAQQLGFGRGGLDEAFQQTIEACR